MSAQGQVDVLNYFNQNRKKINKTGMGILGTWAVGNIGVNSYYWANSTGRSKYFHQMNTYWNAVNLGLASYGYIKAAKRDYSDFELDESIEDQRKSERIYLINAVLDAGYIVAGIYMQSAAGSNSSRDRLYGYGQALFWQGLFLAVFDSAMYLAHTRNEKKSNLVLRGYSFNGRELGIVLAF